MSHILNRHNERCKKCKAAVQSLLAKIYGSVERNYSLNAAVLPEGFSSTQYSRELSAIYKALGEHRGFLNFVRARRLPRSDFFVPKPGFVIEFDESQHFTKCRAISLQLYPDSLPVGFIPKTWMRLCESIEARDNDPPWRDETRAWYDTLRDFAPIIMGLEPTKRIYAKAYAWCGLDPDSEADVEIFKTFLEPNEMECL